MPELREQTKAKAATAALNAYLDATKVAVEDRLEDHHFADLIADLMHLADDRGFDGEHLANCAAHYYFVEQGGKRTIVG
jgi:hypothetical protein